MEPPSESEGDARAGKVMALPRRKSFGVAGRMWAQRYGWLDAILGAQQHRVVTVQKRRGWRRRPGPGPAVTAEGHGENSCPRCPRAPDQLPDPQGCCVFLVSSLGPRVTQSGIGWWFGPGVKVAKDCRALYC